MFVIVDDEFTKHGLTLEEAYILYRVKCFERIGEKYHESAEVLAKSMGKSRQSVINYINSLIEKGFLKKEYRTKNTRYLIVNNDSVKKIDSSVQNLDSEEIADMAENAHHEDKQKEKNKMSNEEFKQFLKVEIQKNKSRYNDSDEEFY